MDFAAAKKVLEDHLSSGRVLKKSIDINGNKVEFNSLEDMRDHYNWICNQEVEFNKPRERRYAMHNNGDGLY